jgi:citrate synthase
LAVRTAPVISRMTASRSSRPRNFFATARTAGWLAHAFEEYDRGRLLRARAVYTGN